MKKTHFEEKLAQVKVHLSEELSKKTRKKIRNEIKCLKKEASNLKKKGKVSEEVYVRIKIDLLNIHRMLSREPDNTTKIQETAVKLLEKIYRRTRKEKRTKYTTEVALLALLLKSLS